jgi:hypothetical protein
MSTFLITGPALYQWICDNFLLVHCRIIEQPRFFIGETGEVAHRRATIAQDRLDVHVLYSLCIENIDKMLVS